MSTGRSPAPPSGAEAPSIAWDQRGERRRKRWHLLYFLLAGFDIITVSASLYLNHSLMSSFAESVDVNSQWSDRMGTYSDLAGLATNVNMPGNEVFDTLNVPGELQERDVALAKFDASLDLARMELSDNVTPAVAAPLLSQLDKVSQAMRAMTAVQNEIFEHFRRGEGDLAGAKMATMDRNNANVAVAIGHMGMRVREIQNQKFAAQNDQAQFVRGLEMVIALMIVFMVVAVTFYGHKLAQEVRKNEEELQETVNWARRSSESATQANRQLVEQRAELQSIIDAIPAFIFYKDTENRILDLNQHAAASFGLEPSQVRGETIDHFFSEGASEELWRDDAALIAEGTPLLGVEVIYQPNGAEPLPTRIDKIPLKGADGEYDRMVAVATDVTEVRNAQRELEVLQDRFQRSTDGASDGLWDYEPATGAVWFSDQFKRLIGLSDDQFDEIDHTIQAFTDLLHPLDKETTTQAIVQHLNVEEPYDVEHRLRMSSGEYRWFRARGQATRTSDGAAQRMSGSITDIHDHRTASSRLELATRAAGIGLWDWDVPSGTTYFNDTFFRSLGYEPGELEQGFDTWRDLVHPDDIDGALAAIEAHLAEDTPLFSHEQRLRKKDGTWTWFRNVAEVVEREADGTPKRMIGVHIDIHAMKKAGETLAEITTALDASNDSVFMFDADTLRIVYANHGAMEQVGYSADELRSMTPLAICPEFDTDSFEAMIQPLKESPGMSTVFRTKHQTAARELIPVEVSLQLVPELGSAGRFVAIVRDIRQQLLAEQRLEASRLEAEAANQAKSEFLANMSHEIRTPMSAILGYADLLESDADLAKDPQRAADAVQTIQRNAHHLLTIINDILDMSKIEAGALTVERMPTDPARIVEEVASLLRPRAYEKNIDLQIEYETEVPEQIQSDPTRLRQILLNLVGNAIKFTEKGSVKISVSCDEGLEQMKFVVRDTGIGMTPEQVASVAQFEAFHQADTSMTRRFGGSGLGLRISNALSRYLGGGLNISSTHGKGSEFVVRIATGSLAGVFLHSPDQLPELQQINKRQRQQKTAPAAKKEQPLRNVRILLAEDGPDNQKLISFLLEKSGAEVTIAENGRIACEILEGASEEELPHLVLMDMQMPELDGYGATRRLRKAGFNLPILALTAHAMDGDRKKCLAAGCDEFLTKPIHKPTLIESCVKFSQLQLEP